MKPTVWSPLRVLAWTVLTMVAFAANSLLTRAALVDTSIDAASFTGLRLVSGAMVLWVLVALRGAKGGSGTGSWTSALALFAYAAAFSLAYVSLPASTGALLLFGAVQATMIGYGLSRGERFRVIQWFGFAVAIAGLVLLLLPGLSAPPLAGSVLMLVSGVAWGVYSLRGRGTGDPIRVTAGNFLRSVPITVGLSVLMIRHASLDAPGAGYALASGALTSGLGYAIWYTVLPALRATTAATVQLSVPVIAALGGVLLLGEPLTVRFLVASVAILGGIALVIGEKRGSN